MKKFLLISIIFCLALVMLCACKKEENKIVDEEPQAISEEEQIRKFNESFGAKIGSDNDKRNGTNVKNLLKKIINENNKYPTSADPIYVHFESWKGTADAEGTEGMTTRILDSIGDENSTYQIIVDEYTDAGRIKKITIKWVSGTTSEPEIPDEEAYYDEFEEYDDIEGLE